MDPSISDPTRSLPLPPQDDERLLQDIQRFYNTQIEELPSNVADLL